MKNKKLYLLITLALIIVFSATFTGCEKQESFNKVDEIEEGSRIFEVNYESVDYDAGDKFWKDNNDNWDNGGCTAVTKQISNGHRIVGRNMDLNIAKKAAYIVRTDKTEDEYRTIGLAYTFREYAPYYEEVKEKGITDEFRDILPFLCDDVMNDQGLHIEVNMRHGEVDFAGNDQFSLQGTNENGTRRVHMFELPRYIAAHCKTVEEAKEYIKTLDIYSKNGYWNYCFIISDKTSASLLEFSDIGELGVMWNDLVDNGTLSGESKVSAINWIDDTPESLAALDYICVGPTNMETAYKINALAQANFYLNWWAYQRQDMKSGEGRFFTIQSLINDVDSTDDMYDLMRRISYSWFYKEYEECGTYHFDPRSENLGEFQGATYDFIFDPEVQDYIPSLFDAYTQTIRDMKTREEKEEDGTLWESTFTEVVDVTDLTFYVRFFENEALRFKITFDGVTKLDEKPVPEWTPLPELEPIEK